METPVKRTLSLLLLILAAVACDDGGDCPPLEDDLDCVDWCTGSMTGAVCVGDRWQCPDECPACADLYPGEVCGGERVPVCDPSDLAIATCPDVLCRSCAGWADDRAAGDCSCGCDTATGQVRCGRVPGGAG
jgi:hypothetical protein